MAAQRRGVGRAVRRREERRERMMPATRQWEVVERDGKMEKMTEKTKSGSCSWPDWSGS